MQIADGFGGAGCDRITALTVVVTMPLLGLSGLASAKATSLIILGDPMGQVRSWSLLLACFDLIYWSLCGLLFGRVVEG